jgi:hypothetical protein
MEDGWLEELGVLPSYKEGPKPKDKKVSIQLQYLGESAVVQCG